MSETKAEYTFKSKEVSTACITECLVFTNCPKGGDGGHGGVTVVEFRDHGSTDMEVSLDEKEGDHMEMGPVSSLRITLRGDWEAENMCRLLRFAANELENMLEKNALENGLLRR